MREYNLSFIDDENLFNHVKETIEKYRFKINLKEFNKNFSVFKELKEIDNNMLKSLYLLSFKKYEGFQNLNIQKIYGVKC